MAAALGSFLLSRDLRLHPEGILRPGPRRPRLPIEQWESSASSHVILKGIWILNSCWVFISYIQLYYTSVIQRFLLEETSNLDCFSHCCGILQDFSGCLLLKLLSCRQLSGYGVHFLVEVLGSSGGVSTCIAKAKSSWIGLKEYGYQQDRGCWWSHNFILF